MSDALKDIIISDTFAVQSERVRVTLKKECLSWELENTPKSKKVIPLRHLVAVTPCDCSSYKQTKLLQCNYCRVHFHYKNSFNKLLLVNVRSIKVHYVVPSGKHRWKLQSKVLQPLKTAKVKEWLDTVQGTLSELNRPKHLLVFINPYGGKKRAVEIYEKKVLPIFHLAGIETHAVVTQRANHAKELISDIDIWKYDGIICVGGDGMFSEILNSVLLRTQKEKNIDVNDVYNTLVVPRIPLGIIPAGSTNAAVNCITGSSDPISSTLIIVMGTYTGIDLCGIYSKNYFLRFAITFLSYGYFGDVINESEKFRWMGPKRYDYAGIKGILKRKIYEGEIQLRIDSSVNQSSLKKERCNVGCETCHKAPHLSKYEKRSKIRWLSLTGRFIAVNAAVMNCSCDMCPKGISPSQHIGNGYCDVILIHSCSRLNYLRYLLRTTYHHSDPFDLDFVQVYRVREFRFKPSITNESNCAGTQESSQERNTSVWNCDGEIITDAGLSAKMHCQLVNVFGRGFESRTKPSIWSQCYKFLKRA